MYSEDGQYRSWIIKIMVLVVTKINEEFCLREHDASEL